MKLILTRIRGRTSSFARPIRPLMLALLAVASLGVDVGGAVTPASAAPAQITGASAVQTDIAAVTPGNQGRYIINQQRWNCLTYPRADFDAARSVQMRHEPCAGLINQKWIWKTDGTIRSENGLCLDMEFSGSWLTGKVLAYRCTGGANQRWGTSTSNHGGVQIFSTFSDPNDLKCMSASGGGYTGTLVVWVDLCGPQYIEQSYQRGIANPHRAIGLGDSYSAGNGAGNYFDWVCYSSANKYFRQLNPALGNLGKPQYPWISGQQCSGANTSNYWGTQNMTQKNGGVYYERPPQRGYLSATYAGSPIPAYGPSFNAGEVALVTISLGGNDLYGGFGEFIKKCMNPLDRCDTERERIMNDIANLRPRLRQIYRDIAVTAPNAAVRILNYPAPIEQPDPNRCPAEWLVFTQAEYQLELDVVRELNRAIAEEAAAVQHDVGTRLSVVDVKTPFQGHGVCGTGSRWINGVMPSDVEGTYHPNAAGHWQMAQLIAAGL